MQASEADAVTDAAAWSHVIELQQRAGGLFLVMYSRYWRCLIAIYMGASDHGVILQSADPDELWQLMDQVAPAGWQADALPPSHPGCIS